MPDEDCGECEACIENKYDGDDPSTHCIDCSCIYCIPGA